MMSGQGSLKMYLWVFHTLTIFWCYQLTTFVMIHVTLGVFLKFISAETTI